MANPVEDQIYEYIKARRPLKLFLLATTFIGIMSSAIGVFKPIVDEMKPHAIKTLGIKPPQGTQLRYDCIYQRAATSSSIYAQIESLKKEGFVESARTFFFTVVNDLELCQKLLGVSQFASLQESDLKVESIDRIAEISTSLLRRNDDLLTAHLVRSNLAEYNFFIFCSGLQDLISATSLPRNSNESQATNEKVLAILQGRVDSTNQSYQLFAELFEYKIQDVKITGSSIAEISASAKSAAQTLMARLKNEP